MDSIGAFEAKTQFARLLERVRRGETIVITKHGTPVARLVPAEPVPDRRRRAQAIAQLKAMSQRYTLGGLDWKVLRDEGRK